MPYQYAQPRYTVPMVYTLPRRHRMYRLYGGRHYDDRCCACDDDCCGCFGDGCVILPLVYCGSETETVY